MKKAPEAPAHACDKPMARLMVRPPRTNGRGEVVMPVRPKVPVGPPIPDGKVGDVWLCDECLTVWKVGQEIGPRTYPYTPGALRPVWRRAGWWTTRKARRAVGTA
ncbi:hypothetical protein SEA_REDWATTLEHOG_109 [Gordonia phage RedWattleHog]|nr:hypothetical protein SEA_REDWATTLEHOG_109 [Gordonia phage RedWattleHog]